MKNPSANRSHSSWSSLVLLPAVVWVGSQSSDQVESHRQIFGAGGAIIQKKNKEKEKGKGKELVTHFTPFMHKLAVQSILAVRVGAQAVGCI